MSDQPTRAMPQNEPTLFPIHRSWWVATIVAGIMVLLSMLGVGLATASSAAAPAYWMSLVPVFGVLCIGTAWARAKQGQGFARAAVIRQLFHWLGIGVALAMDFLFRGTGQESGTVAGLNALLLLAVGCYLAGVHLEWMFVLVGVLLTITFVFLAKAEEYLWLMFVVGGLALAALFGLHWTLRRASAPSQ